MNDELIKRPVRYSNGKCGPMIVDDEGLSIAVAAFWDREQQVLEHIALALNEYPDQAARISELEAEVEVLTEALERDKKQKLLDFAVQQFTGFHEAIRGRNDVTDLASSMGLTKSEFKKIRKELYFMHHDELAELDEYFKEETR